MHGPSKNFFSFEYRILWNDSSHHFLALSKSIAWRPKTRCLNGTNSKYHCHRKTHTLKIDKIYYVYWCLELSKIREMKSLKFQNTVESPTRFGEIIIFWWENQQHMTNHLFGIKLHHIVVFIRSHIQTFRMLPFGLNLLFSNLGPLNKK